MSSAKAEILTFSVSGKSDINILYKVGLKIPPWGTPELISVFYDNFPKTYTWNVWLVRYSFVYLNNFPVYPSLDILNNTAL